MMQRRHLLLALAAATLVTAHQAAGAADDQEKKMPNADAADSAETLARPAASPQKVAHGSHSVLVLVIPPPSPMDRAQLRGQ